MKHEDLLQRIRSTPTFAAETMHPGASDLGVAHRFPRVRMTVDEILKDHPQLTQEDVRACIAFGSEMTRERTVHVA
jgi:hypothetical protein